MALPHTFEIRVTTPAHTPQMTGASNSAGAIKTQLSQVAASMDATNTAVAGCGALSATDRTTWQGIYAGWQAWSQSLTGCLANVPDDQYSPPTVQCFVEFGFNWMTAFSKLAAYQQDVVNWQNRVKAACSWYQPSPQPTPPGSATPGGQPTPSWICSTFGIGCGGGGSDASSPTTWADALKWTAFLGLGLLAAWYVGPLVATVAGVGAGAIRKRVEGSDEFEPVRVRGRGNYSFGDMAVEAPGLDPMHFGDVPRDDVLALIASGQE